LLHITANLTHKREEIQHDWTWRICLTVQGKREKRRSDSNHHRRCRSKNSVKKLWKGEKRGRYRLKENKARVEKCPTNSGQELMKSDSTLVNGKA